VPTGDVNLTAGLIERGGDPRQRLGTVDQDLEAAALPRRRLARRPETVVRRFELRTATDPTQAAPMMGAHQAVDSGPGSTIERFEGFSHALKLMALDERGE
jgi:hypothetical protein